MRALRLSALPLATVLLAGAAAGQTAARLVVFEDFMRPT
jgi:hypothetical protein